MSEFYSLSFILSFPPSFSLSLSLLHFPPPLFRAIILSQFSLTLPLFFSLVLSFIFLPLSFSPSFSLSLSFSILPHSSSFFSFFSLSLLHCLPLFLACFYQPLPFSSLHPFHSQHFQFVQFPLSLSLSVLNNLLTDPFFNLWESNSSEIDNPFCFSVKCQQNRIYHFLSSSSWRNRIFIPAYSFFFFFFFFWWIIQQPIGIKRSIEDLSNIIDHKEKKKISSYTWKKAAK